MTTLDEALAACPKARDDEETVVLIGHAINDPLVQIWPEIDGHERAVSAVSARIAELLDLMCTADGEFNALLALEACHAALDHLQAGIPDDHPAAELDVAKTDGRAVAQQLREKHAAREALAPGELVGHCTVNGHTIPITK